ncbi:fluoride efflux transporter CrcB [Peptoniphilus lacrimalis]|uniref:fluoride efflux transporter CrcB n=1 Tax=Peptoniphilus lacrimalis TaxID=33031 RepID=UPI00039B6E26|nr:fluoride efflux transporter CrcB [Peptoniphilus lacrimalis]MDK7721919.1 fluoride efflux transporter CrcB [Peptoniphilus lacrimalis]MDK7731521.1 fluoride efflux transporter CrcB [Peptoniphilus lacrimalis]
MNIIAVSLGGALGSISRYLLGFIPIKIYDNNIITIIINILGSFLIGLIVAASLKSSISEFKINFLKTGFCGGFTTFSTFSLEIINLLEKGKIILALSYLLLSVIFSLIAIYFAFKLVK